jgi:hypothetical protein
MPIEQPEYDVTTAQLVEHIGAYADSTAAAPVEVIDINLGNDDEIEVDVSGGDAVVLNIALGAVEDAPVTVALTNLPVGQSRRVLLSGIGPGELVITGGLYSLPAGEFGVGEDFRVEVLWSGGDPGYLTLVDLPQPAQSGSAEDVSVEPAVLGQGNVQGALEQLAAATLGANPYSGAKWAALGTSITHYGAYTTPLATLLGATLTKLGVPGGDWCSASPANGNAQSQLGSGIPADAALITLEGCITDFLHNAPLGTLADTLASQSFYGGLHQALLWLMTNRPNADLALITDYGEDYASYAADWQTPNQNGNRLGDFWRAMHEVGAKFGVPVIPMGEEAGISGPNIDAWTTDKLHPNSAGGRRIAGYLAPRLIAAHINIPGAGSAPANTVPPAITTDGTPQVGETISASTGTWTNSPTGYTYQWLRNLAPISDATSSSYELTEGDGGQLISCAVTASNAHGSATATSAPVTPDEAEPTDPPVNTVAPVLAGSPIIGQTLICGTGTWTGAPTEFAFQWTRDGDPIEGETDDSYVLVEGDEGHEIACIVTATNGIGSTNAESNTVIPGSAGDFDPSDVAGLWADWDAASIEGIDGDPVSVWPDSSGNGHDLAQPEGANQPALKASIINGHPVVRCAGNDWVVEDAAIGVGAGDLSIFAVVKGAAANGTIVSTRAGTAGWLLRLTATGALYSNLAGMPTVADTFDPTEWNIVELVRTGTSVVLGHNGSMASPVVISNPATTATHTLVGGESSGTPGVAGGSFLNGDIARILVFEAAVSNTDRALIEAYLAERYDI